MPIRQYLIAYAATALIFLGLDAVWLSTMAERLYRPAIGHLMLERLAVGPALAFYPLYVLGVVAFAVAPGMQGRGWPAAIGLGALLGLLAYGTYDLTNQATLKGWPLHLTLADMAWGCFATATSAALACRIADWAVAR